MLRIIHRYNPMAKTKDRLSIFRTNISRSILASSPIFKLYKVSWQDELFNKANKSDNNLKCINSNNKNVILSFILFSLLVSVIKLFCGVKAVLKHGIAQLSLLNCINTILCLPSFLMHSHTKADREYIKFYELLET